MHVGKVGNVNQRLLDQLRHKLDALNPGSAWLAHRDIDLLVITNKIYRSDPPISLRNRSNSFSHGARL